jgi:hypothetical protein
MRSTRLLVVVPAAAALVFTGLAPASAHDDRHHGGHGLRAEVEAIGDHARADHGKVKVAFAYDCYDGRRDSIKADVTLTQKGSRYGNSVSVPCDVNDKWVEVWLYEQRDDLDNGHATVTVKLRTDHKWLDEESEHVWVSGADHDRRHDGNRHHDKDRHHDKHYDKHHH